MACAWFSDADKEEPFEILKEGRYTVQLGHWREEHRGNYDCLIFPFSVNGKSNIVPHEIILMRPISKEDKQGIDLSRRILSQFYRCFGIAPDSDYATPDDFFHASGDVRISRNASGYLNVSHYYPAKHIYNIDHNGGHQPILEV